jgi:hypothetical protein
MHLIPGRGPLVHDATKGTPKVLDVSDADNRVQAVDANDVLV